MASLFFSYSHKDEDLRNQLETHLAALQRQRLITSWHDRRITAGSELGDAIDAHLDSAGVILLLISPDFIASDYCYNREMNRAMERHHRREARVIPVILRPCDWHDLPFGKLLGVPRDGRPIITWTHIDEAFLDVERAIKETLRDLTSGMVSPNATPHTATIMAPAFAAPVIRSSNLRIRKKFTDLDMDRFRHEGFEFIARFFDNSLQELVRRNPSLDHSFRRVNGNRFSAAIYLNGQKVCEGSAGISEGRMGSNGIEYSMQDNPMPGGMNDAVYVKADDQTLYFEPLGMQSFGQRKKEKLSEQGAAEFFWDLFIRPLQR